MIVLSSHRQRLALVLILGLVLRLAFFLPHRQTGDALGIYLAAAHDILAGDYRPGVEYEYAGYASMRLGVILPAALLLKVFGYALPPLALYPLLCSLLTLALIYSLALRVEARFPHAAILAGGMGAFYPLLVTQAPLLLADTPKAFYSTAALLFFLRSREKDWRGWDGLLCGIFLGLAYSCQLGAFFLIPGAVGWLAWRREFRLRQGYILLGIGIAVALETLFLSLAAGQLTLSLLAHLRAAQDAAVSTAYRQTYFPGWSRYFPGFLGGLLDPTNPYFALHGLGGWFALAAVLWALRQRDELLVLMVCLWSSDLFILNFSPVLSPETRYLSSGIPPLCALSGAFLACLWERRRRLATGAMGLLAISSLVGCTLYRLTYQATEEANAAAMAWIRDYPFLAEEGVAATHTLVWVIRYGLQYKTEVEHLRQGSPLPGEIPRYIVCFFNGYFSPRDLPPELEAYSLRVVARKEVGFPELERMAGFLTPKIGFSGELVLFAVERAG